MAVEFGDHGSGFHHAEVIKFINNEVLMNGGGPEFYMTFRALSWNEIEDQLHTILVDPKVSRSLKRACTWSALALSVRVAARQREQQAHRVWKLQDQVGECESASWTLVSELRRLREERDQAAAQLLSIQAAIQEAMDEREILLGRLLQAERSALAVVPETRMEHSRTSLWSFEEELEELEFRESQNMSHLEAQIPILSCVPGLPSPWIEAAHPFLRMPVPHPLTLNAPFSLDFPYSTPAPCPVLMDSRETTTAMATGLPQIDPSGIYPPGLWVTLESQRQNECSETVQVGNHLEESISHSEEDPEKCQETSLHGDRSNNHKENHAKPLMMAATEKKSLVMYQETAAVEVNRNHSIKEESVMPQEIAAQGNKKSSTQKKYPEIPWMEAGLKDNISHNTKYVLVTLPETDTQVNKTTPILKKYPEILLRKPDLENIVSCNQKEDTKTLQRDLGEGTRNCQKEDTFQKKTRLAAGGSPNEKKMPQGTGKSQSQKEEPNRFQANHQGKCKGYFMNKCPKNQLAPKQKVKQPQGIKALESKQPQRAKSSESKQQEKPLSHRTSVNWVCSSCKAVNRSCCKGCCKCAKASAQLERKDFD
ncbi:testis-expressed protein 13C-1-like [Grammomys surdaster]|uniref:testis-expressed protein 13C-1-like n=1 Tax=Grammomys surdaster TaxID=491861 RepID=UPI0010A01D3D|nr:testis-expressed protein 13C-1-like [Grammomys surdaster]